jgi:hypothetical protein
VRLFPAFLVSKVPFRRYLSSIHAKVALGLGLGTKQYYHVYITMDFNCEIVLWDASRRRRRDVDGLPSPIQ